ncbi:MAG: TonB family protein [Cyclobacteriaceae bacterium]|nr:TonB family protein [Flammeovirgaceae bacterium]
MEAKKNPRYDVQKHSGKFFLIGLVLSSAMAITAFEWRSEVCPITTGCPHIDDESVAIIEEIPPTYIAKPQPVPKPNLVPDPKFIVDQVESEPEIMFPQPVDIDSVIYQPEPEVIDPNDNAIFLFAEVQATPVNGLSKFYEQISRELKYPRQARQRNVEGQVIVQFVVSKTGELTDFTILRSLGAGCDEEAIRVLSKTKWEPGRQRGKPVRVRMAIAIHFRLHH